MTTRTQSPAAYVTPLASGAEMADFLAMVNDEYDAELPVPGILTDSPDQGFLFDGVAEAEKLPLNGRSAAPFVRFGETDSSSERGSAQCRLFFAIRAKVKGTNGSRRRVRPSQQ